MWTQIRLLLKEHCLQKWLKITSRWHCAWSLITWVPLWGPLGIPLCQLPCYHRWITWGMCQEALDLERSHGEERTESKCRKDKDHDLRDWTSCRVQASFHALSVALEWAATASSAMATSTGCTRNAMGSSAWKRTLTTDVHGARELHAPWMADHRRESRLDLYCIELGFNDWTLVSHFVSSPRGKEKRDSRDERDGQGRKRNRNESKETGEIKTFPPLPLPAARIAGLAQLQANISWIPRWRKIPDTFATPDHPPVGPDKLEVVASSCYLGDMLSAAGGCELTTTTPVKTAWKKFKDLLSVLFSCHLSFKTCGRVYSLCAKHNAPCQRDLAIDKAEPPASAAKRQGNYQTDPISYLCGLALRIWTLFWRREDWWYGHVERSNGAVKTAFDIQVDGKREPGRPKMTWKQLTERDCREWKLSAINPHDRRTWYDVIWCESCHACSKPAIWKGVHWCGCWPCTCTLIKNPIMIWWYDDKADDNCCDWQFKG